MTKSRKDDFEPRPGPRAVPAVEPEVVVDLGAADANRQRLRRLAHPSRFPDSVPCPKCNNMSDLEAIDLAEVVREQRCTECGYGWSVDIAH